MSIHHAIPSQISSYINEEYPLFVEFISAYYEWLESSSSPYHTLSNHLSYLDFRESLDEYVSMLKGEYLSSVPEKVLADKELLIRYSKQFFQSLGSQKSFKFLFKILFDENIEIYYPKDDILRVSDGKWVDDEVLMYVSNRGNIESFLYQTIEQKREVSPGIFTYAYATVNRIINRYANKFIFSEIYLTDVVGEFDINYPIGIKDKIEWILPLGGDIEIVNSGMNYTQDNLISYSGDDSFALHYVVTEFNTLDTKYKTLYTNAELSVVKNGNIFTQFEYDGLIIVSSELNIGDVVSITFPVYEGLIVVDQVRNSLKSIQSVNIVDTPFGIVSEQVLVANVGGAGATLLIKPVVTVAIPGYFFNDDSFLSSSKKLQDSDYYQDFSYVIKASHDVEKYRDVVMRLLHPAGMKMIGEVNILELIKLMIRDIDYKLNVKAFADIVVESVNSLYAKHGYIEDFKYVYEDETYPVNVFKDIIVGDVVKFPDKLMRFHPSSITVV